MSIVPWKSGKLLVWDVTCADTFAPSYTSIASSKPGAVAAEAEERKCSKYSHLSSNHILTPVSIETSGSLGPKTRDFLKELGYRLRQATGEINSSSYLLQRLSIAVQRGNMTSVMGSTGHSAHLLYMYYLFIYLFIYNYIYIIIIVFIIIFVFCFYCTYCITVYIYCK